MGARQSGQVCPLRFVQVIGRHKSQVQRPVCLSADDVISISGTGLHSGPEKGQFIELGTVLSPILCSYYIYCLY